MKSDEDFQLIENRLSAEAKRLGAAPGGCPPASRLAAEFERRARRRRWAQAACAVSALALLAAVWMSVLYRPANRTEDFSQGAPSQTPLDAVSPVTLDPSESELVAIPVLIASHTEDGQPLVVTGWYIPEQAPLIELLDLAPADFDAAGRLYGTEGEAMDMGTI